MQNLQIDGLASEIKPSGRAELGQIERRVMNGNQGALVVSVPRNVGKVLHNLSQLAEVMGERWKYRIPFAGKVTEGATVGCALTVARSWGNCDVTCADIEDVGDAWIFHATFVDLETGFRIVRPYRQRKGQHIGDFSGKEGKDRDRGLDNIFLIGVSKAMRNVVVNALRDIVDEALRYSEKRISAKMENRTAALAHMRQKLEEFGIDEARVARHYNKTIDRMSANSLAILYKELQAIDDNIIDAADAFPVDAKSPVRVDPVAEGIKGSGEVEAGTKPENTRKHVKVTFRGEEISRTAFVSEMRTLFSDCETGPALKGLLSELDAACEGLESSIAQNIRDQLEPAISRAALSCATDDDDGDDGEEGGFDLV